MELKRLVEEQLLIVGMNFSNLLPLVFVLVFFADTLFECETHVMVKIWLYFCTVVFSLIKGLPLLFFLKLITAELVLNSLHSGSCPLMLELLPSITVT